MGDPPTFEKSARERRDLRIHDDEKALAATLREPAREILQGVKARVARIQGLDGEEKEEAFVDRLISEVKAAEAMTDVDGKLLRKVILGLVPEDVRQGFFKEEDARLRQSLDWMDFGEAADVPRPETSQGRGSAALGKGMER